LSNDIEFEVESFDDLIWDGTQIRLKNSRREATRTKVSKAF